MKKIVSKFLIICLFVAVTFSCDNGKNKEERVDAARDSVVIGTEPVDTIKPKEKKIDEPKKKIKKEKKTEQLVKQETKVVEEPQEIGASPDAVSFLDDSETETSPKFPDGEKALKKLLKKTLRKAGKGEKATFRASIVIKKDGTVGRVQFTECGYIDEYKPEIIAALQALPAFTPGTRDGKPLDSWYYLTWKR